MLHLVHLRPHYFVHSVITIMRIKLGCPVLKKQLYCPSSVWGNAHELEETHRLFYHGRCNSSSTLFCVGSGSTRLCNMNHCSKLSPISFYTKAVVSTSCVFTKVWPAHSTGTVQDRMLFTKSKFFLVAYFHMPIISKI